MEFKELKLKGVFEITLKPLIDQRGFFMRTLDDQLFKQAGLNFNWVQENHSRTIKKYTIRGMHFQLPPFTETKLIRCIRGKVYDVFVDLRKDSQTFGQWDSIILEETTHKLILLPKGFAHGFCTLTDESHLFYKHDNYFSSEHYSGILWNDDELNIHWPSEKTLLSDKDKSLMPFSQFKKSIGGL